MGGCSSRRIRRKKSETTIPVSRVNPNCSDNISQQSVHSTKSGLVVTPTGFAVSSAEEAYRAALEEKVREVETNFERGTCPTAKLSDFEVLGYLSKGAFGLVFKVQHLESREVFALKVLSKQDVVHRRKVEQVLMEKKILAAVDHVFIVKLHYAFKDNAALYLVLELAPCGDFLRLLTQRSNLSEDHAKIYAAQVVLVLEYLHAAHILFRDLKPENILVDQTGYLKVTDFGFAKRVVGFTTSFCGTLEYLSPEQVMKKPYSKSVDWWALGILIYEMLHGRSPYACAEDDDKLVDRIKGEDVSFHETIPLTRQAKSVITGLLEKDTANRLGVSTNGVENVKKHEWFASIRFVDVYHKNYPPPFMPNVQMRVKSYRAQDFPDAATDR